MYTRSWSALSMPVSFAGSMKPSLFSVDEPGRHTPTEGGRSAGQSADGHADLHIGFSLPGVRDGHEGC